MGGAMIGGIVSSLLSKPEDIIASDPSEKARESLKESFGCCDYIIVLDEYTLVRLIRVFKRWINQRRGKEAYNSEPTLVFLLFQPLTQL